METISTNKAPAAVGPYSQGIKVSNLIYTSGQLPIIPETGGNCLRMTLKRKHYKV